MAQRPEQRFSEQVARKVRRKLRARRFGSDSIYFWFGMFGMVGWSVAVPTLLAVALGVWLDRRWPVDFSWTLTLLVIGVALGCLNAWTWIKRSQQRDDDDGDH